MKPISKQTRQNVVAQFRQGQSIRNVANTFSVGKSTVQRIRSQYLSINFKSPGGRPTKLSAQAKRICVSKINSGKLESAVAVKKALEKDLGVNVSVSTVKRGMYEAGLGGIEKKKKPKLSPKNFKARLASAKAHKHWTIEDWRRVIFSDETKINRFGSDGCRWAWIRDGESLQDRHIKQTVKHGGGSIMIWGCMTARGSGYMCKIDNKMDQHLYLSILKDELNETIRWYHLDPSRIVFQHDNDPKHTAKSVQDWLKDKNFEVLQWPPQSPDLNPIGHLWVKVKRGLNVWDRVQEVWNKIEPEDCLALIDSMPRRIKAVITSKGKWTKY